MLYVCVLGRGAVRPELRGRTVREGTVALPSLPSTAAKNILP